MTAPPRRELREELAKAAFAFIEARQLRSPEAKRRTWEDLPPLYQRDYLKHADQLGAILARELAAARKAERERAAKIAEEPIAGMEREHAQWRESLGIDCAQPHEDEIRVRQEIAAAIRALED